MSSTAVVPSFKATRRAGRYQYVCRACGWVWHPVPSLTRDERMWTLSQHLKDAHAVGPLVKA